MLIIGDLATNKYNPSHPVKTIEIVYIDDEELEFIINKYELRELKYVTQNYREYIKGEYLYKLFSKDLDKILAFIIKHNFALKFKPTVANPFINFVFDCTRVVKVHAKLSDWENRIRSYTFLRDRYITDLVLSETENYDERIERYYNLLKNFAACQAEVQNLPHQYREFDDVSKYELLGVVTTTALSSSPLHKITGTNSLNEEEFNKLRKNEQITACMECLYIDVLNEFVIPALKTWKRQLSDKEVEHVFDKCIMYRCSQPQDDWFSHFIVNNYKTLLREYHSSFYECFRNSIRSGDFIIT